MESAVDLKGRPFHFIGIGGIGMSALAQIVAGRNLPVSGSDLRLNHITQRLEQLGAHIFQDQVPQNIQFFNNSPGLTPQGYSSALPQVICSTAISSNNLEYKAALELGCPIFHRSDLLAALIQEYGNSIAVSGTHGKTTTSALMSHVLYEMGQDPTVIIGGEIQSMGGNARLGQGSYLVAEADESDGSLVKFRPHVGIITNIELDHPDHYSSLDKVIETFSHFSQQCQVVVGCVDSPNLVQYLQPSLTYSLDATTGADYTVSSVNYQGNGTTADIIERGKPLGSIQLQLLGSHNLSNALAVIAVARYFGLEFEAIASALSTFTGTRRRFEYRGSCNDIVLVDDYAHHPSEIKVTLAAARLQIITETTVFPIKPARVVAIFQPHRYSRTQAFLEDFAQSFTNADVVVISDVYGAGETPPEDFNGSSLAQQVQACHPQVEYCPSLASVETWLSANLKPGDLAVFLGAGDLSRIIPNVLDHLKKQG